MNKANYITPSLTYCGNEMRCSLMRSLWWLSAMYIVSIYSLRNSVPGSEYTAIKSTLISKNVHLMRMYIFKIHFYFQDH